MRSSQFRGITLHLQRDTPCIGLSPGHAPMLFETYTTCRPNEKIFRCPLRPIFNRFEPHTLEYEFQPELH